MSLQFGDSGWVLLAGSGHSWVTHSTGSASSQLDNLTLLHLSLKFQQAHWACSHGMVETQNQAQVHKYFSSVSVHHIS